MSRPHPLCKLSGCLINGSVKGLRNRFQKWNIHLFCCWFLYFANLHVSLYPFQLQKIVCIIIYKIMSHYSDVCTWRTKMLPYPVAQSYWLHFQPLWHTPGQKKMSLTNASWCYRRITNYPLAHLNQDVRYLYPEQRDGNLMLACFRELVLVNQRTFPWDVLWWNVDKIELLCERCFLLSEGNRRGHNGAKKKKKKVLSLVSTGLKIYDD